MAEQGRFRSVLPHEPWRTSDGKGYILLQGAYTPRMRRDNKNEDDTAKIDVQNFWTRESLADTLCKLLTERQPPLDTLPFPVESVVVLDENPPFSKVRLVYANTEYAFHCLIQFKQQQWSSTALFSTLSLHPDVYVGSKPLLSTLITQQPLPEDAWPRAGPPKFRRLIPQADNESTFDLEAERLSTRFLFLSNLVSSPTNGDFDSSSNAHSHIINDALLFAQAIRLEISKFDSTGDGVEVFIYKTRKMHQHCHVAMRTAKDAQRVFEHYSQYPSVTWSFPTASEEDVVLQTANLFVDYASATPRPQRQSNGLPDEVPKGSRSECTSTTDHVTVPGLHIMHDFVSKDEEQSLLAVLTGPHAPWAPPQHTPTEGQTIKRKVQHYGYVFDYKTANVLRDRSLPHASCPEMPKLPETIDTEISIQGQIDTFVQESRGWEVLSGVIVKVRRQDFSSDDGSYLSFPNLNQLTVNSYEPGEGIGSHVDTPSAFSDGLISLSLNGGIVMEFRKVVDESQEKCKKYVYLPPRSLLLMSGPVRYEWEHMIVSRMTDTVNDEVIKREKRISLTLRTALDVDGSPMPLVESSHFPLFWKSADTTTATSALATPKCEKDHVHAVYDAIATQWHHTRGKRGVLWPGATQFLQQLPQGSVVADIGCGDGKYFPAIYNSGSYVIGTDISLPLLQAAVKAGKNIDEEPESRQVSSDKHNLKKYPEVAVADCMNIPMRSNSCDAAICIAVMHHLSTQARRIRCIEELARIVRPGGLINIQAWAIDQTDDSRRKFASNDVFVPFNANPKYLNPEGHESPSNETETRESKEAQKQKCVTAAQAYSKKLGVDYDDRKGLVVFKRYCHLYRKDELVDIAKQVGTLDVVDSGFEAGNYFVILKKRS